MPIEHQRQLVIDSIGCCRFLLGPICGGHGYSENNRIGRLMNDMDVFCTAEGDSTVLYQQLARYLVTEYKKKYASSNQVTPAPVHVRSHENFDY